MLLRGSLAPEPGEGQQRAVQQDEAVVDDAAVQRPAPSHVEPAEVEDHGHHGPVKLLGAWRFHEVRGLQADPDEHGQPHHWKVESHAVGPEQGKESDHQDAGADEEEVPQEVDNGRAQAQLVLVLQEGAQGLVVVQQRPGHTQECCAHPQACKHRGENTERGPRDGPAWLKPLPAHHC